MPLGKLQGLLVDELASLNRLTPEQRDQITASDTDLSGDSLEKLLLEEYKVPPFALLSARAHTYGMAPFNIARARLTPKTFEAIPREFCEEHQVFPIGHVGAVLLVACGNPFDLSLTGKLHELTGKRVVRLLSPAKELKAKFNKGASLESGGFADVVGMIDQEYGPAGEVAPTEEDVNEESGPIIELANRIVEDAYLEGSSDIHLEPQEHEMIVRYRVDGVCSEKLRLPRKVGPALIARLKIMCNLDISERRLPQDGRIVFKQYTKKGFDLDLRVSTAPLNHGEGVVMRILDKQKTTLPLPALGFSEENLAKYRECIRQPYGMILHCGPTGSGKSMTLYSALNEINTPDIVIRTAEDPIEYTLPGLNQMQMHRQIGLTFATALRAFLRQDPDIILVGEIRDKETADIAVEAALTGHLLISTLHTNDAPSTIARLSDMGVEPFMVSSALLCVCAQRLMRRICKNCRIPYTPEGREQEIMEKAIGWNGRIYKHNPKGCPKCNGTGYKGRVGIHELMVSNEELVNAINKEIETSELKKIAVRGGMKTLHQDSLFKVKEGLTTMEEAISTVPPDM